jgi:hypothetical protein
VAGPFSDEQIFAGQFFGKRSGGYRKQAREDAVKYGHDKKGKTTHASLLSTRGD